MKLIILLISFLLLIPLLYAFTGNIETFYNPFGSYGSGNLQFIVSNNQSFFNFTFGNVSIRELLVLQPPVECPVGTFMTYTNLTTSICVADGAGDTDTLNLVNLSMLDNGTIIRVGNISQLFDERNTSLWNKSGNDIFNSDFDGNVGIGTTNPEQKLEIGGYINVTGESTSNSTFQGDVKILGTIYGSSPVKVDGLNVTGETIYLTNEYSLSPQNSVILRRNRASGAVFGIANSQAGTGADSGVSYVWVVDGPENVSVDVHSSTDPNNPLTMVTHYNNNILGHIWRLSANNLNAFFRWEIGLNKPVMIINRTGQIIFNNSVTIDKDGNLGIGTTSPNNTLEVIGSARISDSLNASFINATDVRTLNLQDRDGSNFFEVSCSTSQTLTALSQIGGATCSTISITESQISNLIPNIVFTIENVSNTTPFAQVANHPGEVVFTRQNLSITNSSNITFDPVTETFALNLSCIAITGSADLCDGSDATSAAGDTTDLDIVNLTMLDNATILRIVNLTTIVEANFNKENLTFVNSSNVSYNPLTGQLVFNLSCEDITGSASLCDGDDATSAGGPSSNFRLENVSNATPFAQIDNHPLFSAFTLENVSNQTFSSTAQHATNISSYLGGSDTNGSLLKVENISNILADVSGFTLENVSNRTNPNNLLDVSFGDWTCSAGVCTLNANVCDSAEIATNAVKDDELDYSAVTINDFTDDKKMVLNGSLTVELGNLTVDNLNVSSPNMTIGGVFFFQLNSTCNGMQRVGGTTQDILCDNPA